jgi:DSF synthase
LGGKFTKTDKGSRVKLSLLSQEKIRNIKAGDKTDFCLIFHISSQWGPKMTVVTKPTLAFDRAGIASASRLRQPVDITLLDNTSSVFSALDLDMAGRSGTDELNLPEFDAVLDDEAKIYWLYMRPEGRPIMTLGLLRDAMIALNHLGKLFAEGAGGEVPARYTVMASRMPGIFNLGGDLRSFAEYVRNRDRVSLEAYGKACIEPQFARSTKMNLPLISISLVQGDALGGGFECALADDVIIAEKSAKFGLPECLFSLFPGMGALSFLTRKIGAAMAEKMVFSGKVYSAAEMHDLGVVDVLAEDGMGEQAVYDFVEKNDRAFASRRAVYSSRQVIHPITRAELDRIVEMWIDAALSLGPTDIRVMERLASAQDRRWAVAKRAAHQ